MEQYLLLIVLMACNIALLYAGHRHRKVGEALEDIVKDLSNRNLSADDCLGKVSDKVMKLMEKYF
jgi:hypothetical protein